MALIPVAEAHARLMRLFAPLGTEEVPLTEAAGRVLARDVVAARAQPPFAASAMDGYAIRSADADAGARLRVVGTSAAGARFAGSVGPGEAVRIFTGAPVPEGADAILIQEDADADEGGIVVRDGRDHERHIRPTGGDFQPGARVVAPCRLGPADLALLAAMNADRVTVARRPVVALIPTGDELVMPGEVPGPDQIVSSNGVGLKALLEAAGAVARILPIARDTPESLAATFGLAAGADLIVTLGGASVGDFDLVQKTALAHGLALDFYRVAMRPGKPLLAGTLEGVPLVGLPGNPVSAMVTGAVFLRPAVARMQGLPGDMAAPLPARLGCDLGPNGPRMHFMRATAVRDGGGWRCTPAERQDSSLLSVLAAANALLVRAPHDPARREDEKVEFVWLW
jgi:molybdopterin molybdotransferase